MLVVQKITFTFNCFLSPDGHALSKKLAKQVKNCDKKLKGMLAKYSSSRDTLSADNKRQVKELQISDLTLEVEGLFPVENPHDVDAQIPYYIRRQAIDMLHLLRRSNEEIKLVEDEMKRVFGYYQNQESLVSSQIDQLSSDDNCTSYTIGSISLLKSTQKILQRRLLAMHSSLKDYITLPTIHFTCHFPNDSDPVESYNNLRDSCPDESSTDDSDQE